MNKAVRRLMKDKIMMQKEHLRDEGIYIDWDDHDIYKVNAMIIGPNDTPYENGFYFFKFKFTEKFPFKPPQCKFMTIDNKVRFNPNLYASGKVCLSLLGTWAGPKWTACQNIRSLLLSIQSLLSNKFTSSVVHKNYSILELKYNHGDNDSASKLASALPIKLTKYSKYITGINSFRDPI